MGSPEDHVDVPVGASDAPETGTAPASVPASPSGKPATRGGQKFGLQRQFVRLVATGGVIGIGTALGAILTASKVQGWIIGLVVALVSVLLAAILWSSRALARHRR